MPTYEYACKDCGNHLEVVQKFSDPTLTECPSCHGTLRKVFGNVGIVLKGSGFYKTDSRGSSKSSSSKSSSSSSSSSDGGSGTAGSESSSASGSSDSGSSGSTGSASSGSAAAS